jgi:hypothetical protein
MAGKYAATRKAVTIRCLPPNSRCARVSFSCLKYFFDLHGEKFMRASRKLAAVFVVAGVAGACAAIPAYAATGVATSVGSVRVNQAVTVVNHRETRIESFKVPATYEIHGTFGASGTVQQLNGKKWQAAPSATVALWYRSLPSGNWVHAVNVKTSLSGAFTWRSAIHKLGKFAWQARVKQSTVGSTEYKGSVGAVKDSLFADRTYVTHFVAMHFNGDTGLAAIIQDYPQSGGVSYANVTGTAKFYYEPNGSRSWQYLGEAHTDAAAYPGSVAIEPGGTLDGTFKIVFPAQGDFLGSSASEYLG